MIFKQKYPYDSTTTHHILVGIGLCLWIFSFLYFTEPLDVNEFNQFEKLMYLPFYGIIGGMVYVLFIPFQTLLFKKNNHNWTILLEFVFTLSFLIFCTIAARSYYLYVIMVGETYPYTLVYFLKAIIFPAALVILPIMLIARYALGKYYEKKINETKIEIKGEGNYEGLQLFLHDVICIQSADNYIEVYYLSAGNLKKSLIRNKLSVIDNEFSEFLRVHRSYIINPYHFLQWKTEKGKLWVELSHSIFVPISNTYKSNVKSILNSTTK